MDIYSHFWWTVISACFRGENTGYSKLHFMKESKKQGCSHYNRFIDANFISQTSKKNVAHFPSSKTRRKTHAETTLPSVTVNMKMKMSIAYSVTLPKYVT